MSEYGQHLKVELIQQGRTQAWLASELGISTAAVSHWIKGRQPVPATRQEQILGLLGLETDAIERGDLTQMIAQGSSPMAFTMREIPDAIVTDAARRLMPVLGTQDYADYSVRLWAKYLLLSEAALVAVMRRQGFLTEAEVMHVWATGIELTYLGEHLSEAAEEADLVAAFVERLGWGSGPGTWADLDLAVAIVDRTAGKVGVTAQQGHLRAVELKATAGYEGGQSHADLLYQLTLEMNQ